ncbi:MAG TPA: peptidase T [Subdoligranulum sp.]|nr:peptidase T [Subdoligranulum sp.]
MDTADDASGENVRPQIHENYDGEAVTLPATGTVLDPKVFPFLREMKGQTLITTDGSTLLGADDKAGVAEIMTALERIIAENRPHGKLCIGFTPDEEIGRGADCFDLKRFAADYAYTVDGGELGEIEYENFNAAGVTLTVHGVNTHPGTAKGKMRNALLYLHEFIALLPAAEAPAHTEGREGFYHVAEAGGNESEATLRMLIRDHDRTAFEQRKQYLQDAVDFLNRKYGADTFALRITDSYYNMREVIEQHMEIVQRAQDAMRAAGVEPVILPIRGGTDGARLSFDGLPCPNLSTGGMNFHSIYEAIPVEALSKMVEVLIHIVTAEA